MELKKKEIKSIIGKTKIENDNDILNRIKFDIFYVENWSLFLDIKIIVQTIINAVSGEEKAY